MEIVLTWSWLSFFVGVLATISLGFWALVVLAFKQWKKSKKQAESSFDGLLKEWSSKK